MKISIVTPCYNYGNFLPDAVRSVRRQGASGVSDTDAFEAFQIEHIIVDAGSSDGTVDWLEHYASEAAIEVQPDADSSSSGFSASSYTFRYISEPDKGQTDAINKGLRMATGDVVCWLNADEYYLPGALQKIAEAFQRNPDADLIHGEAVFVDTDKKPLRVKRDHRFDRNVLLYYGCYIQSCSTFWRRRILDEGHYLDDNYKVTMDFEYWVRLMRLGYAFKFIPEVIAAFMWHDANVSEVCIDQRKVERVQVQRKYGLPFMTYPLSKLLFQIWRVKHAGLIIWRRITNDFREPEFD
jgi:glycosyltransferase involved in cell wall biosynthesis